MHSGSGHKRSRQVAAAALFAMSTGAASVGAQPIGDMPQGKPADSVARGKQLFMANGCYSCHGTEGQGGDRGAGPKLAPDLYPMEAFVHQLRHPRSLMPRYPQNFVSDADVADMHAYLGTVKAGPKAKDIPLLRGS